MEYEIQFHGTTENVAKAIDAMQGFSSMFPPPKDMGIYKMIPISEDYFYFLLSQRGLVSKEQGEKSLKRFKTSTSTMSESLVSCYKFMAEQMLYLYDKYGACTLEAWKQKYWDVSEQPAVKIHGKDKIMLCGENFSVKHIVNMVCEKYHVTAKING